MKTLLLVRHGKAEPRDSGIPDFDRHLIDRGKSDAEAVAWRLKDNDHKPSLIITSPAPRSLETARIMARVLGYKKKKIKEAQSLYDQDTSVIETIVANTKNKHKIIMLVGHNPSIEDMARYFVPDFSQRIEHVATSGVAGIQFDGDAWSEACGNAGHLLFYESPGTVDAAAEIEGMLVEAVTSVFRSIDENAVAGIDPVVRKACGVMARDFMRERTGGHA